MGSWGTIFNNTRMQIRRHTEELARLQEQIASGKRLVRASDQPADAYRVLQLRGQSAGLETCRRNLESVVASLESTSSAMEEMNDALIRARELLTRVLSGTIGEAGAEPITEELNSLLEQMLVLANTEQGDRYLFGGSGGASPYVAEHESGVITRVTYRGDAHPLMVPVAEGLRHSAVVVGERVLRADERQAPVFVGRTGATPGEGTASVRGEVRLVVEHTTTTYLGGGGIAPGDSSADGDTVIGFGHTLEIDEPAGTLRLDGGPAVSFTPGDTDVRVENADGDLVYVNTAGLVAGFQGFAAIDASGRMSIDDGATWTDFIFTDTDVAVADSRDGRVLFVDCDTIVRTGTETVMVPGTYDAFEVLISVRDALRGTNDLTEAEREEILHQGVRSLAEVSETLSAGVTSVGARLGGLGSLRRSLEDLQAYANQETAGLENADVVEAAAEMARRQTLYEMTLATASRLLSLSLLDFI
jgi:flagellin-like hook-associated protein FlgL